MRSRFCPIVRFKGYVAAGSQNIRIGYGNAGSAGDIHFIHDNIHRARNQCRR